MSEKEQFDKIFKLLDKLEDNCKKHTEELKKIDKSLNELGMIMMIEDVFKEIDDENV